MACEAVHEDETKEIRAGETGARAYSRIPHHAEIGVHSAAGELFGWSLNISLGGVRAVLACDDVAKLRAVLACGRAVVTLDGKHARWARIAWVSEQADGAVVGFAFEESALAKSGERRVVRRPRSS